MAASDSPDPSWIYFSVENDSLIKTCQHCHQQPYVSLTIVSDQQVSIRRIDFTTISHDQGFSDNVDPNNPYAGSSSWFDARIIMPSGHERVPRRHLQNNVCANFEFKTHINSWNFATTDPDLQLWLAAAQTGDTIQIVPMAHFPAWANFVRFAKISLWAASASTTNIQRPVISLVEQNDYSAHRPLRHDLKEIRLIEIQPDEDDLPVRLILRHTFLSAKNRLTYNALSYCWGVVDELQKVQLTTSDHSKPSAAFVNRNLLSALKRFRSRTDPRTMWCDLLCINQTDLEERNMQVAMMGQIFTAADKVCVWLGDSDPDDQQDCQVIRSISDRYDQDFESQSDEKEAAILKARFAHKIITGNGTGNWNVVNDRLFQRTWFERVWVLQEVWNAARIQVFCGSDKLEWKGILQANQCLKKKGVMNKNILPWLWDALFNIEFDKNGLRCNRAPRLDILTIFIAAHGMKATDPRDKIFAMLVFGNETHDTTALPKEVKPSYDKSAVQVYTDFTRWWILHHGSLRILSAVHTLTGRSWVNVVSTPGTNAGIDLSQRSSWMLWHEGFSEWMHGTLALHGECSYSASADRVLDHDLLEHFNLSHPNNLVLRGAKLGAISSIVPYPFYQNPPVSTEMQQAFIRLFDPNGTIGTWNSFRFRMSVGEPIDMLDHGADKPSERFSHYVTHWNAYPEDAAADGEPTWLPCLEECMFTTSDGRVGLCPSGSRVGDLIVLLNGGKVPYLLRSKVSASSDAVFEGVSFGEYYFVGECYLEGSMHGKDCPSTSDGGREIFSLV